MRIIKYIFSCFFSIFFLFSCSSSRGDYDEIPHKKINAKAAKINIQLGLGYLKQGNVQRAKRKLLIASEQAPNSADVAGALGYFFEKTANKKQALNYYERAMQLAPGKGPQLNNYGAFLCRQGSYEIANQYFEKASKDIHYINSAGALENAGLCALLMPNVNLAKNYFKKAFEQDQQRVKSLYELVKINISDKNYKKALQWIEQYQSINSLDPVIAWLGYEASQKAGLKAQAKGYAWILKNRFTESKEYKQLIASNDDYDKRISSIS